MTNIIYVPSQTEDPTVVDDPNDKGDCTQMLYIVIVVVLCAIGVLLAAGIMLFCLFRNHYNKRLAAALLGPGENGSAAVGGSDGSSSGTACSDGRVPLALGVASSD